jgi:hypothetical protein
VSAEARVKLLREMPSWIAEAKHDDERQLLYFAAGYVISKIGGAEWDLRLAEGFQEHSPNVLIWAAVLGSVGASTFWSDAFGGIGRLVARELSRSVDLLDAPTSDISDEELQVVVGKNDAFGKIRTALRNVITISMRPGVAIQLSLLEEERTAADQLPRGSNLKVSAEIPQDRRQLEVLAEQLFPFLRPLLIKSGFQIYEPRDGRSSSRRGRSPQLPLKD